MTVRFVQQSDEGDAIVEGSLTGGDWVQAGIVFAVGLVIAVLAGRLARRLLSRLGSTGLIARLLARFVTYVTAAVGLIYALTVLGVQVGPLLGAIGLGGLVLALALQKVVENFVGALIIQTRRPFDVGDTIEIGDTVGVVLDVDTRETILRAIDATEHRIPNSEVIASTLVNLTRSPVRRSTVSVGVAYDSDLELAHRALRDAMAQVARVSDEPAPLVVLHEFASSSIDFAVHFWHASDVASELEARHDVLLALHRALNEVGVTIAFPQVVVWPGHELDPDGPYESGRSEVFTELPDQTPPMPSRARLSSIRGRLRNRLR